MLAERAGWADVSVLKGVGDEVWETAGAMARKKRARRRGSLRASRSLVSRVTEIRTDCDFRSALKSAFATRARNAVGRTRWRTVRGLNRNLPGEQSWKCFGAQEGLLEVRSWAAVETVRNMEDRYSPWRRRWRAWHATASDARKPTTQFISKEPDATPVTPQVLHLRRRGGGRPSDRRPSGWEPLFERRRPRSVGGRWLRVWTVFP